MKIELKWACSSKCPPCPAKDALQNLAGEGALQTLTTTKPAGGVTPVVNLEGVQQKL